MLYKNTHKGYGLIARLFHFFIAVAILYQLYNGFMMVDLPQSMKAAVYSQHKTYGLLILTFVVIRMGWRYINVLPDLPASTPNWQVLAARSLHRTFYVLMIAIPVTGWAMSTAAGFLPVYPWLGKVALPLFSDKGFCLLGVCVETAVAGSFSHDTHAVLGYLIASLLVIHTSIALYHAYLKDGIFSRIFLDRTT